MNVILGLVVFLLFVFTAACQQSVINSSNSNANRTSVSANTNSSDPSTLGDSSATTIAAGSPSEAYVAAYNARKNKDMVALRALLSKDILEFFAVVGQEEKKSVDDLLQELVDRPQANVAKSKNERIDGDKATLEYLDVDGQWRPMDFIKEDGVWKLTIAGDPQADAPPNTKSNTNK